MLVVVATRGILSQIARPPAHNEEHSWLQAPEDRMDTQARGPGVKLNPMRVDRREHLSLLSVTWVGPAVPATVARQKQPCRLVRKFPSREHSFLVCGI